MSIPFETDDGEGKWCENCLIMTDACLASIDLPPEGAVIRFDARSGRFLCSECEPHPMPGGIDQVPYSIPDSRGNRVRVEGCDRCYCGCKYWENDRCVDCGGTEVNEND
jgi:hypothetical protein